MVNTISAGSRARKLTPVVLTLLGLCDLYIWEGDGMDRRFVYLDEGDMMEAISDYVNKKSLRRLVPDWETLDVPFKVLQFECFMPEESHERVLVKRAVQFEPPALSREEILFTRDEGSGIINDDDVPVYPSRRPRPPNHPPDD